MDEPESQNEVIAFLADPATHGGPVERIDTHGASVFLTGDRAYKLKRAVRYSYLDFSTRERRRVLCEREFELNQRTAPDIYLGVLPIVRRAAGDLAFGSRSGSLHGSANGADILDWVVEMRRFETRALFATMASEGRLTPAYIRDLADRVVVFHTTKAPIVPDDGIARVRRVIEGNRISMAATGEVVLDPASCERLEMRSLDTLARVAPILQERARQGWVRHGHGDLHLGNICLWQGEATPFDCIEFNDEFAISDVLYDIAFAIMDLWHRGERALASLLFNRYFDMADLSGAALAVLPLFLSMRAAVRAHVEATTALQVEDLEGSGKGSEMDAKGRRPFAQARGYLADALAFLEPAEPRLIAIGGWSGTGKSTLAAQLAGEIGSAPGARWLRTDVLRKRMAGLVPEVGLDASAYTPQASAKVYARLLEEAGQALRHGSSVILDGVFAQAGERGKLTALARDHSAAFHGIWLEAPPAVLRKRVSERTGDASDATLDVVAQQIERDPGDLQGWAILDASGSLDQVRSGALGLLVTKATAE